MKYDLSFPRLWVGVVLLFTAATALAQSSLNVKVRADASGYTRAWLRQAAQPGFSRMAPPDPLVGKISALQTVESLRAAADLASPISQVFTLNFSSGSEQEQVARLQATGLFEFVEPNRLHQTDTLSATATGNRSISPNDDSLSKQWYHAYIGTFAAWEKTRGSSAIRVGVIDTGLDFGHEEFQGQVYVRPGEDLNTNGTFEPWPSTETRDGKTGDFDGKDNDGNGYADDVAGYDFVDQPRSPFGGDYLGQDPYPLDQNGHGTVVSGIVAARADNGKGGTGIAPDCRVVVLRAFNNQGAGEDDDIARAIVYAADNGIPVLNFSFGDAYASGTMYEAIRYAYAKGVTMVASSGNGTGDNPHYPSDYSEVLCVAATDANGTREYLWPLSSFGVSTDLAAPGSRIFAPMLRDTATDGTVTQYVTTQGTSTAAPMVSAAVALLFADRGQALPPRQVRGMLTTTCDDLGTQGWDHYTGAGRLNVARLLEVQGAAIVQIGAPLTDDVATGNEIVVLATVLDPAFDAFSLEYQKGAEGLSTWLPLLKDLKYQVKDDTLLRWNIAALADGIYTLRLRVNRSDGLTTEDRVRIRIDRTAPEIALGLATTAWDNDVRGLYMTYRDSDPGMHQLRFRPVGEGAWQTMTNDRKTQNGDFLVQRISDGLYEACVVAGDSASSDTVLIPFQDQGISFSAYTSLGDSLPLGNYLPQSFDFDHDGFREVVMSQYDSTLGFGPLCIYEYGLTGFQRVDSSALKPVLIPKGVADTDGDGLLELLCSVRDSTYLLEQKDTLSYPSEVIYTNFTPDYYAASFSDTDGDGVLELVMRQSPVVNGKSQPFAYDVYEGGGSAWAKVASLPDLTPYSDIGGATSRVVCGDFDGDGQQEALFGDYDGDLWLYEFSATDGYTLIWQDSSALTHTGDFLVAGDLDGNPGLEFASLSYTRPGRLNDDNEYDPAYAEIRIWQTTGENSYSILHREVLYDLDVEDLQAVSLGELDGDPGAELVISTYPRTYVLSHSGEGFGMDWFIYGSLATDHVIGDFDKNGKNELLLGTGDKAERFAFDDGYAGPAPVTRVEGWSLNAQTVKFSWLPSPNAGGYTIWRGRDYPVNTTVTPVVSGLTDTFFVDTELDSGVQYLYVIQSTNAQLSPAESDLFQAASVLLTPHETNTIVSVLAINDHQAQVVFALPIATSEQFARQIRLLLPGGEEKIPIAVSNAATTLLVSFGIPFPDGRNLLLLDPLLLDTQRGVLSDASNPYSFLYLPTSQKAQYLTSWEVVDPQTALLRFRWPVTNSALNVAHYEVSPIGSVASVSWSGTQQDAVLVRLSEARLGSIGYPVSITVQPSVCTSDGVCVQVNEGGVATFAAYAGDLIGVYSYPNPVVLHDVFATSRAEMRFGNLSRKCQIQIMTVSGSLIVTLSESGDGDGGLVWDLMDRVSGKRVAPGLYVYRVWDEEGGVFVGQFSVLE